VSISEPARASVTRLAVRLGLALEREEAGNRVARLDPTDVGARLAGLGLITLSAERYAMYYRHEPGAVFRLLSRPRVLPWAVNGWRLANAIAGRAGNKLALSSRRD
jgi:hypothetical protein